MKKLIPILIALILSATACLREGTGGCPACMYLVFTHQGSVEQFDSRVGNDVELQIYYDGLWHSTRVIPYEQIAGGRRYFFLKGRSRQVDLIAYAVPRGADRGLIPEAAEGARFTEQAIRMRELQVSRALPGVSPAAEDIFAGTISVNEPSGLETSHQMSMSAQYCRVSVIVEGAELFHQTFPGAAAPSVGLTGVACHLTTGDGKPCGDEVEVHSPLSADGDNLQALGMRMLPSHDGVTPMSVNIYKNTGEPVITAYDTGELSKADKDVRVVIRMDRNAVRITLEVDGWVVRTETVPLK